MVLIVLFIILVKKIIYFIGLIFFCLSIFYTQYYYQGAEHSFFPALIHVQAPANLVVRTEHAFPTSGVHLVRLASSFRYPLQKGVLAGPEQTTPE